MALVHCSECSIMFTIILLLILLYICSKLTCGRCTCNTSLIGKTAIVTGGNSGIGYSTALGLAGRGCKVIIADVLKCEKAKNKIIEITGNPNVFYKYIDLASFASIRTFAEQIKCTEYKLHFLINNAGSGFYTDKKTDDGCNVGMQINHFGSFLLTHLLIDLLKKSTPSRITFTSSHLAFVNNLSVENLINPSRYFIYQNSKVCNIISADGFARLLKGTGVTSNSVHPGLVNTNIFRKVNANTILQSNWFSLLSDIFCRTILPLYGKTSMEGAQSTLHAILCKDLEKTSGVYFSDCKPFYFRPSVTKDLEMCTKIWQLSESCVKLAPEEKLT